MGETALPFIQSGNDLSFNAIITDIYPIAEAAVAIDGVSSHDLLDVGFWLDCYQIRRPTRSRLPTHLHCHRPTGQYRHSHQYPNCGRHRPNAHRRCGDCSTLWSRCDRYALLRSGQWHLHHHRPEQRTPARPSQHRLWQCYEPRYNDATNGVPSATVSRLYNFSATAPSATPSPLQPPTAPTTSRP